MWTTLLAVSLNGTIFDFPKVMPWGLLLYPSFNICRIFYFLTIKCGYSSCISDISYLDPELRLCLIVLFITPFIYSLLGIYFYEIIPQQFGVKKHPFFCLKGIFKKKHKKTVRSRSEDESSNPHIISIGNDDELSEEIKKIKNIKEDKHIYPLIVEDLTKVRII